MRSNYSHALVEKHTKFGLDSLVVLLREVYSIVQSALLSELTGSADKIYKKKSYSHFDNE